MRRSCSQSVMARTGPSRPTTPVRAWRGTDASNSSFGRSRARSALQGLGANGLSLRQAVLVAGGCIRDRPGDRMAVLQPDDERPATGAIAANRVRRWGLSDDCAVRANVAADGGSLLPRR